MDYLTRLESNLLKSLLGLAVAVAWTVWQCLRQLREERRARAAEQEFPVLRLPTWRSLAGNAKKVTSVKARRVRRAKEGLVAVLVSQSRMEGRVLRALGGRTNLWFTSTWAELKHAVVRLSPCMIFADPVADGRGDPEAHLAHFSQEGRVPVVLYTTLSPESARILLELGNCGIRHVIFRGYDDEPRRFVELLAASDGGSCGPPLQAA